LADRVLINLATGLEEDPERVTRAFLVAAAALRHGSRVAIWLTKEAVRLALPGHARAVSCEGCPPLARLFDDYVKGGGELLVCPTCLSARRLDVSALTATATLAGTTPTFEWAKDEDATVLSY
jgi:predicted peroxiredoxin